MRYSHDEMELPTLRPGTLLGTTAAVAASLALLFNAWLLRDEILVARALANGSVSAEELEQLNDLTTRLVRDPAPNEEQVLRVREVMRLTGNREGVKVIDEFLTRADFTTFSGRLTSAQAFDALGRHGEAASLLQDLIDQRGSLTDPDTLSELLITAARNRSHLGRFHEAHGFLEELARSDGDISRYRQEYVSVLAALGDMEKVESLLGGEDASYADRRYLASIFSAHEQFERAAQIYLDITRDYPDDYETFELAGDNTLWSGDFDAAANIYARLLELGQSQRAVRTKLAQASLWADRPDQALPLLSEMVNEGEASGHEIILFLHAIAASETLDQRHRQLLHRIDEGRNDHGSNPDIVRPLAAAMSRIHEFGRAAQLYLDVARENPNDHEALGLAGDHALWSGEFAKAADIYGRLVALGDADARMKFARASLWADKPEDALPILVSAVRQEDGSTAEITLFLQAVAASDTMEDGYRELVLQIHEGRDKHRRDHAFLSRLGDAMSRIGENERAIPVLESVVAKDQNNPQLRLRLAESLREAGRFSEAEEHYQRLLADWGSTTSDR